MECTKKVFETMTEANTRANEINSENKKTTKITLRVYKCNFCSKYHLSSMSKHRYKWKTSIPYRNEIREKNFLKIETEYWEKKFGIED